VLSALERSVNRADFGAKLAAAQRAGQGVACETAELDTLLGEQGWVLVSKADAIDAMAAFIAAFVASLPEAQGMSPEKLQHALLVTIQARPLCCTALPARPYSTPSTLLSQELKTSKLKLVWQWGRYLYRGAAFAYSAFALYENPWLIRACLTALWTGTHLLYGLLLV